MKDGVMFYVFTLHISGPLSPDPAIFLLPSIQSPDNVQLRVYEYQRIITHSGILKWPKNYKGGLTCNAICDGAMQLDDYAIPFLLTCA